MLPSPVSTRGTLPLTICSSPYAKLIGTLDGTFPDMGHHSEREMGGLWMHPIKVLDGFWLRFHDQDAPNVDTWALAEKIMASVGDKKAKLLYLLGDQGLNVIARGSYHAEVIDLLSNNLAVVDSPSSKGTGNEVDMEQILLWNPDVILFSPDSIYGDVADRPEWQTVSAVQSGRYYEVPFGPYNWLGFPPSVQRYLGMMWMSQLLYPETAQYDLYEAVKEYYELFYHAELTFEQFDALVANAIGVQAKALIPAA